MLVVKPLPNTQFACETLTHGQIVLKSYLHLHTLFILASICASSSRERRTLIATCAYENNQWRFLR